MMSANAGQLEKHVHVSFKGSSVSITTDIGLSGVKLQFYAGGKQITLVRKSSLFSTRIALTGIPWAVRGDCDNYDYKILNGRKAVAVISGRGFFGKTIAVEIPDPANEVCAMAVVAAVITSRDALDSKSALENF